MGEDMIVGKRFARTFVQFAFLLDILQRQTRLQPTVALLLRISLATL
jgi:hypothetical protein